MNADKHNSIIKSPKDSALKELPLLVGDANIVVSAGLFSRTIQ